MYFSSMGKSTFGTPCKACPAAVFGVYFLYRSIYNSSQLGLKLMSTPILQVMFVKLIYYEILQGIYFCL